LKPTKLRKNIIQGRRSVNRWNDGVDGVSETRKQGEQGCICFGRL
jgi:hypothetical protein